MSNYLNSLNKVIKREFGRILGRKTLSVLYVFLPVSLFLIFAIIYKNALITELPVAVCDNDHSEISRTIIRFVESASSMRIVAYPSSPEEIKALFLKGKIDGAFYFPANLEKELKAGKKANAALFINATNIIKSNYMLNDGKKILKTISGGALIKKLKSAGLSDEQALGIVSPVNIDTQVLFNSNYSYFTYLIPGLASFGYLMVILIASVIVLSSEFTHGTFNELLATAGNRISVVILGKSFPHIFIHSINFLILLGLIFPLFGMKIAGSVLLTILFCIYFSMVAFSFGLMISALFKEQMLATEAALLIITPAFIYSGLTFPLWAMPQIHVTIARLIPYTYFLSGFYKLVLMNAPAKYLLPDVRALAVFLIISVGVTASAIYYRLNKSQNLSSESEEK